MKIKIRLVALTVLLVFLISLISPFFGLAIANANPFPIPENRPIPENIPIPDNIPIPGNRPTPDNIPVPDNKPIQDPKPIPDENLDDSSRNIPEGNENPPSPFEAAKQTFKDILSDDLGIDPANPRLEDLNKGALISALGEFWGYKEYLEDAAFTWDLGVLGKDAKKGYKYYKLLKMYFKSPAEIKAAWNNYIRNADTVKSLRDINKLKGNVGKLKAFWSDISKAVDVDANAKQIGKLRLFGPTAARMLGKFSPWMATYDTVTSGLGAIRNFAQGNFNQGFQDAGHALMAGAVVLSATGAGAPVAAGVAAVGAVLWAGAKIWQHRETIGRLITNPGGAIKSVVNTVAGAKDFVSGVANKVSGAIDTVKGWFGK
jgi:hypothetical protein